MKSAWRWWRNVSVREGRLRACRLLLHDLLAYLRDSTPARLRARYGDADYDWEYRVNTTSAAVGWRDRLLGVFHSPYQPTEAVLFHEMMKGLAKLPGFDFDRSTFLDLGSGKGRALLMAADYPFRRIVGVELLPALHQAACENIGQYRSEAQKCFALASVCGDATEFAFPDETLVLFLFNPFPESGLQRVMANLRSSLKQHPRSVYLIYHNPVLEHVLVECPELKRVGGTHQYVMYASVKV